MDTTGMAAVMCRHELVAVAVNMFTPENFCYYDIVLERMLKQYSQESGRLLMWFFLDMLSNVADLANTEILQGSADDAEDTASDLAEFDMEDPVGVELNDFVDILDASILDDEFESVHG